MITEQIEGFGGTESQTWRETERAKQLNDSRNYLGIGVTVGVVGAASAFLIGATCPICAVAAPALMGVGIFKRWQAHRK